MSDTGRWAGPAADDEYRGTGPGDEHRADAGPVIDFHFPVEVHTVGTLPPEERERLARTHLDRLGEELAARL
ncbi:hypothetical protein [Actinomadura rupiterrae]|uniref:hypothetical protein n=1 Tax=Actinomadura rupiterrae TaxID=559627 RepID=UPI0020A3A4B2|nr:hypothetical protein [Actinomadura rupiterrae]MCP2341341.1 hypothetical protein [Actinomadura rupiterrae]